MFSLLAQQEIEKTTLFGVTHFAGTFGVAILVGNRPTVKLVILLIRMLTAVNLHEFCDLLNNSTQYSHRKLSLVVAACQSRPL